VKYQWLIIGKSCDRRMPEAPNVLPGAATADQQNAETFDDD
jgi:hypothetical protein